MRLVVAINHRCTISYCARRPIVDQSWRPATDGRINRCILRPIVRALVAISCGTRRSIVDQFWVQRSIARSIVASCDRSLRPTTGRTINRGTNRPINRSIVRPIVRPIVRLPIRDHPQLVVLPCTTGGTIT